MRENPNIAITGTPGTGKTSHAELLAQNTGLKHVSINQLCKDEDCYDGYDERLKSKIVDEDRLLDILETMQEPGGLILDWHGCNLYPKRWIDLCIVIRTSQKVLRERLEKRGYESVKVEENVDVEVFEEMLNEARESYDEEIVVVLQSDGPGEKGELVGELEGNVERIEKWVGDWRRDNGVGEDGEGE